MPDGRLQRTRETLPAGYQFGVWRPLLETFAEVERDLDRLEAIRASLPSLVGLGLSTRVVGYLWRAGIQTTERLIALGPFDLLRLPGIGRGSLAAVERALAPYGLSLARF
ncbi:MAG TPA: hypothetical protein VF456_20280 [Vicinamibacterales bacterium]